MEVPRDPNQDPKHCTEWMEIDTPEAITKHLLERNQKHFGQAQGTPFTISPLQIQVDFGATTETCEMMLQGDYDETDVDDLTAMVITHFQTLTGKDVLPISISEKDMLDKYCFGLNQQPPLLLVTTWDTTVLYFPIYQQDSQEMMPSTNVAKNSPQCTTRY